MQTKASAAVAGWTVLASGHSYEAFGALRQVTLGNGLAAANDWSNEGRIAARRLWRTADGGQLSNLAYGYDADDNVASVTNQLGPAGSAIYGYDKVGRLSLVATDPGSATAQTLAYTPGTNRLASVSSSAGLRTVAYDARGNTLGESRPGGVTLTTAYDGHGRLTAYTRTDAAPLAFAYNGLDERVAMTRGSDSRRFVYAPDGRALGEYGASTADVKAEFIWANPEVASGSGAFGGGDGAMGYAPLAVATPDSGGTVVINWIHANHLGVPLLTLDASGNPSVTPNDYLLPGFPGQARVLADLYYNRYRDYDPTTGRYIQADPIGLEGGSNVFAYAGDNPVNGIDPWGLREGSPANRARRRRIDEIARGYDRSTAWCYVCVKDEFGSGINKCNKFVYDVINQAGAPGRVRRRPPLAAEWADPSVVIPNWRPLRANEMPLPGDVAAYRMNGGGGRYSGHTGIITSDGNRSAHDDAVYYIYGQFYTHPTTYRRYTGE